MGQWYCSPIVSHRSFEDICAALRDFSDFVGSFGVRIVFCVSMIKKEDKGSRAGSLDRLRCTLSSSAFSFDEELELGNSMS